MSSKLSLREEQSLGAGCVTLPYRRGSRLVGAGKARSLRHRQENAAAAAGRKPLRADSAPGASHTAAAVRPAGTHPDQQGPQHRGSYLTATQGNGSCQRARTPNLGTGREGRGRLPRRRNQPSHVMGRTPRPHKCTQRVGNSCKGTFPGKHLRGCNWGRRAMCLTPPSPQSLGCSRPHDTSALSLRVTARRLLLQAASHPQRMDSQGIPRVLTTPQLSKSSTYKPQREAQERWGG